MYEEKINNFFTWKWGLTLICVHRLLLDFCYFSYINPFYSYDADNAFFDYRTKETFFLSWIILIGSFFFAKKFFEENEETGSSMVIFLVYLVSYVPFTTLVYSGIISNGCYIWNSIYWLALFILYRRMPQISINQRALFGNKYNAHWWMDIIAILMMVFVAYVSFKYTDFRLNFAWSNVYELRMESREYPLSFLEKYLFAMSGNVIAFSMGYFLIKKRFSLFAFALFVQFLNFSIDGAKMKIYTSIFVLAIVFAQYMIAKIRFQVISLLGIVGVEIMGALEVLLRDDCFFCGGPIRRIFFVPTGLHETYWRFMLINEPDYFRTNLRHFGFSGPYNNVDGISRAIGNYLGFPAMHANNGLFSDAISNFGLLGVVIMPILLILFLLLFDKCTIGLNRALLMAVSVLLSVCLVNSPLITLLFAGGFIILLPCLVFIQREEKQQEERFQGV